MSIFQTCGGCLQRADCIRFHACMKRVTSEDLGAAEKATVDKMNADFARALDGPLPQEDTMKVIGSDGVARHLFRTRAEEDAAVARSPLKVALDLVELAKSELIYKHSGVPAREMIERFGVPPENIKEGETYSVERIFKHDEALLEQLAGEYFSKPPDWQRMKDIMKTYALQMLRRFGG